MDKSGFDKAQKMSDPSYVQRMQRQSMPKMQNLGSIKMPKL
jgi:hypothetical protein